MKILNYGSMNLDYVYQVPRFVQPGETLDVSSRELKYGGKGLNQSVSLARAGARVYHAGTVGKGGEPLLKYLQENGVHTEHVTAVDEIQGHTVIQVNPQGENSILLYGGSNRCQRMEDVLKTLSAFDPGDLLVLQNEINYLPQIVDAAAGRGMKIILNPSPCSEELRKVDFQKISWLIMNEVEAGQITGESDPEKAWESLHRRWPSLSALITLGGRGSVGFRVRGEEVESAMQPAERVTPVDTTGAGDTYTGYFLAALTEGRPLQVCMELASRAAALSVTRLGAAESIPRRDELPA